MRLQGKVAVVTGASMGIGEAIAKLFAEEGASVVLSSRDLARTEAARQRIGHADQTRAVACDVRKRSDIDSLVLAALDRYGRIDIWVNNAGYGMQDSAAAMSMKACRDLFETNLFGAVECMQAVVPLMRQEGSGTIINISSVVGYISLPYQGAYSASKHALNALGHAARVELQKHGIHVMTVCPGYIPTHFQENIVMGKEPLKFAGGRKADATAEDVARATLDGYLKRKRDVIVPFKHRFSVKMYQLFPSLIEWVVGRNLRPAQEVVAEMSARAKKS
jgi:short-subunit dehydrogenase